MILAEPKFDVLRSANFVQNDFRIKATGKAFRILSSGLYSNKIRACVRELSTNAADSHIAAGNQNPFRVHLPNSLEPFFSVRDFGTGLSHDDITNIYTTYFESTKNNSNEATGCLGLGSKSPFSYTDNFTVTSYFNGAKHTYSAYIGEIGCPQISLISTEETDEPNGLEVSFAVATGDFQKFGSEASFVYTYFKNRPEIVGQKISFADQKPMMTGDGWEVYNGTTGGNLVVMGSVAYLLDMFTAECSEEMFRYNYRIVINVAIGEVEMTASRESLEYTSKTKLAIRKRIQDCVKVFKQKLQEELEAKPTKWEACIFYSQNSLFLGSATWKGQPINARINLGKAYQCSKLEKNYRGNVQLKKFREISYVEPNNPTVIVENDIRGVTDRARQYMREKNISRAILITFSDDAEKQAFLDAIGPMPDGVFIVGSTLPKVVREYTKRGVASGMLSFVPNRDHVTSCWTEYESDSADGGVYVEVDHWTPTDFTTGTINNILDLLKEIGHPVEEVVGVRKRSIGTVVNDSNWKSLREYVNDILNKYKSDWVMAKYYDEYSSHKKLLKLEGKINNPALAELVTKIKYAEKNAKRLSKLNRLIITLNKQEEVGSIDVDAEVEKVMEKYPLVTFIEKNYYGELPVEQVLEYIRMVDVQTSYLQD